MKRSYIKPATEIINGFGEHLMVQISGTTTPEETESKGFNNWDFDNSESQANTHSTNAWDAWEED